MNHAACVFCEILAGRHEQAILYRDPIVAAFMDINQQNPGHVLVIPVRHAVAIADLTADEASAIFRIAAWLAPAIQRAAHADGINLFNNNGRAAGQSVFHFHVHILPRYASDKFRMIRSLLGQRFYKTPAELSRIAATIQEYLPPVPTTGG